MNCRSCGGSLEELWSLGKQYLSDFRDDDSRPERYALDVVRCPDCSLVQLSESVPRELLYHDRYGFKSGVNDTIKADLADVCQTAFQVAHTSIKRWLDIASNDGTLLSCLPKEGIYRVGIDPVKPLCEEARGHADLIVNDFFSAKHFSEEFDVITSVSVFYDLDDPNEFVEEVASILAKKGVWIIQQNYLAETLRRNAIDNFCHEHLTYFSLASLEPLLERHGLEVIDAQVVDINGGCIRTSVAHKGAYLVHPSVASLRETEDAQGIDKHEVVMEFGKQAKRQLATIGNVTRALAEVSEVGIYGASTRGATIWQGAAIDQNSVRYAVERNPAKVGKRFSAIGVPIISEEEARERRPDYLLVGPWFFRDSFIRRESDYLEKGGRFIIPLPRVEIV